MQWPLTSSSSSRRQASLGDVEWEYESESGTYLQQPAAEVQPDTAMNVDAWLSPVLSVSAVGYRTGMFTEV